MLETLNFGYFILPILAYLLGSLAFGIILSKLLGKGDIRKKGSGNIGATNAYRSGGKLLGLGTLLLDILKGWLAVYIATLIYPPATNVQILCGFTAIVGHVYPIWHKFKGGKGVATTVGALLAIDSFLGNITIIAWIVFALFFRYASLSSLASILITTIIALALYNLPIATFTTASCGLIFITHRANIQRLCKQTESKIF